MSALKPLVSIIINNHNYGRYIAETMQSALDQSYRKTEIIVVDDGSTDNSCDIIRSYAQRYGRSLQPIFKTNSGQASAMNAGFRISKGEIVCFLDSDDYWFGRKVEAVVRPHQTYGVVQHNLLQNGRRYRLLVNTGDLQRFLKEFGLIRSCVPTSAMSFRRDLLEEIFPLPEEPLRLCADAYLRCAAVYFSKVFSIDDCLGTYRLHGNNGWHDNLRHTRPNIASEVLTLLNQNLTAKNLPPIPQNPNARESAFLESIDVEPGKSYILYGAGDLGVKLGRRIETEGGKVLGFCDDDRTKWGRSAMDHQPIYPPDAILKLHQKGYTLVISCLCVERPYEKLLSMGLKCPEDFLVPIDMEGHVTATATPRSLPQSADLTSPPSPAKKPTLIDNIKNVRQTMAQTLTFMASLGFNPTTVIDVGVAGGTPELYKAFPKSRFLLVEPLAEFSSSMERICRKLNGEFIIAAAGKEDTTLDMKVSPDLTGSYVLRNEEQTNWEIRRVNVRSLNSLAKQFDLQGQIFLKIDVQGGELDVIAGATEIFPDVEAIALEVAFFEFHSGMPEFHNVVDTMKKYGFVVYEVVEGHNRPLDFARAQADVIFVKESGFFRRTKKWSTPAQSTEFHRLKQGFPVAAHCASDAILRMEQSK
jgi:FkbM family methyltransferase